MVFKKKKKRAGGENVSAHAHGRALAAQGASRVGHRGAPAPPRGPTGLSPPPGQPGRGGRAPCLGQGVASSPRDESVRLDARSPAHARPLPPAPRQPPAEGRGLQTAAAAEIRKKSTFYCGLPNGWVHQP